MGCIDAHTYTYVGVKAILLGMHEDFTFFYLNYQYLQNRN